VPAALHVTPEAADGGAIARLRDGDRLRIDGDTGRLEVLVDPLEWSARVPVSADLSHSHVGVGRELFAAFRERAGAADQGASLFHAEIDSA
jgi:phosphogluconate dehydratase